METRIVRFHNIFGPLGTWDGGREKAPAALCRKIAIAKLTGNPEIEIWGDGEQTRSFCYIDDCVEGLYRSCSPTTANRSTSARTAWSGSTSSPTLSRTSLISTSSPSMSLDRKACGAEIPTMA